MPERYILSFGSRGSIEFFDRVKRNLYSYCLCRVGLAVSAVCCVGSPRTRFLFFLYVTRFQPASSSDISCVAAGTSPATFVDDVKAIAGVELACLFSAACGVLPGVGVVPTGARAGAF